MDSRKSALVSITTSYPMRHIILTRNWPFPAPRTLEGHCFGELQTCRTASQILDPILKSFGRVLDGQKHIHLIYAVVLFALFCFGFVTCFELNTASASCMNIVD